MLIEVSKGDIMATILKKQKDKKTLRPNWYGQFEHEGKTTVINTGIPWKGTPPPTLRKQGDTEFEVSRAKAETVVDEFQREATRKGESAHLVERLIEYKTGQSKQYAKLKDLPESWRELDRDGDPPSENHLKPSETS